MFRVFIALVIMQLAACSVFPSSSTKSINLQFNEPNRISFQGKGAGAGIALMGTMGPVGIAIGVAIDEGIAKDIRKAFDNEEGDTKAFVAGMVTSQIKALGYNVALNSEQPTYPTITIRRYGFKIVNGSTDATSAEWVMEVLHGPNTKLIVNYPKDFDSSSIKTYVLADLKTDGKLGLELLHESLLRLLKSGKLNLNNL